MIVQPNRRRQIAAFGPDLPHFHARMIELEDQEARVATVQQSEAITSRLHLQVRPGKAVDDDHVAEEFGIPNGRDGCRGQEGACILVKERPCIGEEQ